MNLYRMQQKQINLDNTFCWIWQVRTKVGTSDDSRPLPTLTNFLKPKFEENVYNTILII